MGEQVNGGQEILEFFIGQLSLPSVREGKDLSALAGLSEILIDWRSDRRRRKLRNETGKAPASGLFPPP